jgi:hypothetical protein
MFFVLFFISVLNKGSEAVSSRRSENSDPVSMGMKPDMLSPASVPIGLFNPDRDGMEEANTERFEELLGAKLPGTEDMNISIDDFDISALDENLPVLSE